MKNAVFLSLFSLFLLFFVSCGETEPTFQEKVETAISEHFNVDSTDFADVLDTIFVADLDSAEMNYNESIRIMEESMNATNDRISNSEKLLEETKANVENISFESLRVFAEENVASLEKTLLDEEANLKSAQDLIDASNEGLSFISDARKTVKDGKAFYLVKAGIKSKEYILEISPDFKVIRHTVL